MLPNRGDTAGRDRRWLHVCRQVFCLGVFLAFAAHFIMVEFYGGAAMQVAMSAAGILIMIGTALVISWYKRVEGRGSGTPKRPPDADLAGGEA